MKSNQVNCFTLPVKFYHSLKYDSVLALIKVFLQLDACPAMLEGGKELTVNLTIRDGAILFDGLTIEGWGSQGTIEDEISL